MNAFKLLPIGGEWVLSKNSGGQVGRYRRKEEAYEAALHLADQEAADSDVDPPQQPRPCFDNGDG